MSDIWFGALTTVMAQMRNKAVTLFVRVTKYLAVNGLYTDRSARSAQCTLFPALENDALSGLGHKWQSVTICQFHFFGIVEGGI
jgi:hypothetical protein